MLEGTDNIKMEEFSSFSEFEQKMFPKLYEREQEAKRDAKKSWGEKLWDLFKEGFRGSE